MSTEQRKGEPGEPQRGFLRRFRLLLLALGAVAALLLVPAVIAWLNWMAEGSRVGRVHAAHQVSHKGWSFPARVYSPEVPLTVAPKRLVAEAKLRGYHEDCAQNPAPGTVCERMPRVTPRAGQVLEPVLLGELIGADAELREHLPLAEAPKHLIDAIVVSEDRDFRDHSGVNLRAMVRALLSNTRSGGYAQGGSTLTMQVVRNLTQRTEKTVLRKLREMAMAMGLERELGKDAVLQMYLDAPYLGQRGGLSVCGFQAAARHYFAKDARALDLAEAATLVAILPGPGKLAPDRFPDAAKARRDHILTALAEQRGYDVSGALKQPLTLVADVAPAEHFPSYLSITRAALEAQLPPEVVYGSGLVVETGIDLLAQTQAEKLFPAKLKYFEGLVGKPKDQPLQAVGIALDVQTGLVRAVFGGTDATSTGFNRATQAHRQPGSSFKPVVYALAMSQKKPDGSPAFTASSTEPNSPRDFKTPQGLWRPMNVAETTPTASLAWGLAWSQNIATASLLEQLGGPRPLMTFARTLGFDTRTWPEEMGLALGQGEVVPIEMAQLAAIVANGGRKVVGTPVRRAVDGAGVERVAPPAAGAAVLTPEAAALTRELMRLVVDMGTGGAIRGAGGEGGYQGPVMGKTGTTDSEKDLWFVGATPTLAAAVWLGYDQPVRIGAAASDLSAPLWGWWMRAMTQYEAPPPPDFPKEPKLAKAVICTETGLLPNPSCKGINAPFVPGTAPKDTCAVEHLPPEPPEPGAPVYESLWKKLQREQEAGLAIDGGA